MVSEDGAENDEHFIVTGYAVRDGTSIAPAIFSAERRVATYIVIDTIAGRANIASDTGHRFTWARIDRSVGGSRHFI